MEGVVLTPCRVALLRAFVSTADGRAGRFALVARIDDKHIHLGRRFYKRVGEPLAAERIDVVIRNDNGVGVIPLSVAKADRAREIAAADFDIVAPRAKVDADGAGVVVTVDNGLGAKFARAVWKRKNDRYDQRWLRAGFSLADFEAQFRHGRICGVQRPRIAPSKAQCVPHRPANQCTWSLR